MLGREWSAESAATDSPEGDEVQTLSFNDGGRIFTYELTNGKLSSIGQEMSEQGPYGQNLAIKLHLSDVAHVNPGTSLDPPPSIRSDLAPAMDRAQSLVTRCSPHHQQKLSEIFNEVRASVRASVHSVVEDH